jgi:hypothetical protein
MLYDGSTVVQLLRTTQQRQKKYFHFFVRPEWTLVEKEQYACFRRRLNRESKRRCHFDTLNEHQDFTLPNKKE